MDDMIVIILTNIISALIGAIFGTLSNEYFTNRRVRKQTLQALVEELRDNAGLMNSFLDLWAKGGKVGEGFYPLMDSYTFARNSGVLVTLHKELRGKLMEIYAFLRLINESTIAINLGQKEVVNPEELKEAWSEQIKKLCVCTLKFNTSLPVDLYVQGV